MTPQALLERLFPPMLATLVSSPPPDEENWVWELKYDGYRAVAALTAGKLALWSRNSLDLAARFPPIEATLAKLRGEMVLDGEIVALDSEGIPRFQLLQSGPPAKLVFVAFDLLWLEGEDVRREPLEKRWELLRKALKKRPASVVLTERVKGPAAEALSKAAALGYEGLIAKRIGSPYEPRRTKSWLKLKVVNAQELAVVGYTPSTHSDRELGALLLGVVEDGKLVFAGKVGTGYTAKLRMELMRQLATIRVDKPPVARAPRMKEAVWVEPRLVAQVKFTEWTADGKLRHPSFLGLRDDKLPMECTREVKPARGKNVVEKPKKKSSAPARKKKETSGSPTVVLSNPDRLVYPRDGITKKDVADYYAAMSHVMIETLRDRPLTLEHWNQGIDRPSWFHQNIGAEAPDWMSIVETPTRTSSRKKVRHLVVDRPETLQWLAQYSALTLHMWSSRGASLDSPDWVVFDLDPAKGKGIDQAVEVALALRKLFEDLDIESYPKTSGKRGIHLFIPLAPGQTHEEAAEWAFGLASAVASNLPSATVERALSKRRGRLYLDSVQNGYGKTIVAPYSLRAIAGAPVSAPLRWEEVTKKLDPWKFNLRSMPARLDKVGDLFAPVLEKKGIRLASYKV